MVDYDIIRKLKNYVGYSSQTNIPTKQRELCYKNYNQNMTPPEWDFEQERYWQVSTVNSILEYIVYFYAFVEEELCYKNYNQNITLPEWDIEQERNWQVSTVNSVLEFIIYFYALP